MRIRTENELTRQSRLMCILPYIPVLYRQGEDLEETNPLGTHGLHHTDLARTETRPLSGPRGVRFLPGKANAVADILGLHLDEALPCLIGRMILVFSGDVIGVALVVVSCSE